MVLKSIFSLHHVCRQIVSGYSLVALPPPHPPPTARMIQAKWVVEIFPTRRLPRNHSLWFATHGWWKSSPADSDETQIFLWSPTHGWWKSSSADSEETHFLWFPTLGWIWLWCLSKAIDPSRAEEWSGKLPSVQEPHWDGWSQEACKSVLNL